jgi:hypothetical protein
MILVNPAAKTARCYHNAGAWHVISIRFTIAVLIIGTMVGLGSAYSVVASNWRPGEVVAGAWTIWPREGARDADPYTRAWIARTGDLPLGLGEGLSFRAERDDHGRRLDGRCSYLLTGTLPAARAWTITLVTADGYLYANPAQRHGFTSAEVLREVDGRINIAVGHDVKTGDWLPAPLGKSFQLVMKLYDTPVAAVSGSLRADSLPALVREGCQ